MPPGLRIAAERAGFKPAPTETTIRRLLREELAADEARAHDAVRGFHCGQDGMVDLLACGGGSAGEHNVAGLSLVEPARMRAAPFRLDVLGADALDEQIGQLLGIAAEPDLEVFYGENRLQVCNELDADGDALTGHLPGSAVLAGRRGVGPPEREQVTPDRRTARRRRLSKLLPASGPRRPERAVDARRGLKWQP
jgi:hypothetical protein